MAGVTSGQATNVANWILVVCMCLATLLKVASKFMQVRNLHADDYWILLAMIFAVGQALAVSQEVPAGFGKPRRILTSPQIARFQKAAYASQFLYILALCAAKVATAAFVATLTREPRRKILMTATYVIIALWTTVAIFGVAFQCDVPESWTVISNTCFDQAAFWDAIGAFDILIDLALVVLPAYFLWDLQTAWGTKLPVMGSFAARGLVIPLTVLRLVYINHFYSTPAKIKNSFDSTLLTELQMNFSIALVTIPFLKTFLDRLQNGLLTTDLRRAPGRSSVWPGASGASNKKGYASEKQSSSGGTSAQTNSRKTARAGQVRGTSGLLSPSQQHEHWQQVLNAGNSKAQANSVVTAAADPIATKSSADPADEDA